MSSLVTLERDGDIAVVQLANPAKKNPLSLQVLGLILEHLGAAEKDGAKVAVIRGSGDSFSAGYNLDPSSRADYAGSNGIVEDSEQLRKLTDLLKRIRATTMPVLTQVHGYCFAGGTDLMLASDIAIAADDAQIGVPNVRSLGISLLSTLWPMSMGPMRTKMMMFTGDWITGRQAEAWGMVALSVAPAELEACVMKLARRISLVPRELLKVTKLASNRAFDVMGIDQMIASAVELDAIAHFSQPVVNFWQTARSDGLRPALKQREAGFADSVLAGLLAQSSGAAGAGDD